MKKTLILIALLAALLLTMALSQKTTDRHHIRLGNRHFLKSEYDKAYIEYGKALSENPDNSQAAYNIACVMTATQNDSTLAQYAKAADMEKNGIRKSMSWHNIGVIMQTSHKYAEAIEAYKNALRSNPADDMTRYNLALCKKLLEQQQQQQNQQQQQDQNNGGGGQGQGDQKKQDKKPDADKQQDSDNQGQGNNNARYWDQVGDNYQNKDQHDKAMDSYKQALKNNPGDQHAQDRMKKSEQKLKEQQQQRQQEYDKQHQQQQQQQQNQDQSQDNQNKNNNNNNNNKPQDAQQPQQGQESQQQPQGQPAGQMSQDNAQRLLEAAMQQEKQTQKRLQGAMQQPPRKRLGKNW